MMLQKISFICLLLLSSSIIFAQENLVSNGQFTEGTEGWEVLLNDKDNLIKAHIEHSESYKDYGLADNFVGTNFVELDEQSAIQQTILTRKGELYTLVFAYAHRSGAGTKQLIITAGGQAVYTTTIKNSESEGKFLYKKVTFTAKESKTKIGFYSVSILGGAKDKGILLTDVLCTQASDVDIKNLSEKSKF